MKQTPDRGMVMNPSSDVCKIDAYPDADLLVCMVMRNIQNLPAPIVGLDLSSIFADCPVFWQSKLQTETALSTMEAKIIALSACCRELFPIMDMVSSATKSVQLPIGKLP